MSGPSDESGEWAEKMLLAVMRAGESIIGRGRPPWEVLADYVAELERRVAELERLQRND